MEAIKRIVVMTIPIWKILLGGLFVYAGVAKLLDLSTFAMQVQRFGFVDQTGAMVLAHYLPFLEIVCGAALLFRRFAIGAMTLYMSLLVLFEAGLTYAWHLGIQADCGCFGTLFGSTSIQAAFVRNLCLLTVGAMVLTREWTLGRKSIE